jgi:hypothetical protein
LRPQVRASARIPAQAGASGKGGAWQLLNLFIAIREAAGLRDRAKQSCHRVLGDMDVVSADSITTDIRDKRAEYAAADIGMPVLRSCTLAHSD